MPSDIVDSEAKPSPCPVSGGEGSLTALANGDLQAVGLAAADDVDGDLLADALAAQEAQQVVGVAGRMAVDVALIRWYRDSKRERLRLLFQGIADGFRGIGGKGAVP